ncbi:MAG: hypothetical protein ACFFB3_10580 [Candidatus Hodarchaeota archaeon]
MKTNHRVFAKPIVSNIQPFSEDFATLIADNLGSDLLLVLYLFLCGFLGICALGLIFWSFKHINKDLLAENTQKYKGKFAVKLD